MNTCLPPSAFSCNSIVLFPNISCFIILLHVTVSNVNTQGLHARPWTHCQLRFVSTECKSLWLEFDMVPPALHMSVDDVEERCMGLQLHPPCVAHSIRDSSSESKWVLSNSFHLCRILDERLTGFEFRMETRDAPDPWACPKWKRGAVKKEGEGKGGKGIGKDIPCGRHGQIHLWNLEWILRSRRFTNHLDQHSDRSTSYALRSSEDL